MLLGFLKAQNINIPDANFKQYLVSNFDTNGDGEIQQSEANLATSINCSNKNISSIEGINSFSNLKTLNCSNNNIGSLSIINLLLLEEIRCNYNKLTSLQLHGLNKLNFLLSDNNLLNTLDFQGLTSLKVFWSYNNQLTSFNIQGLPVLESLDISKNKLTTLDLSGLTNLKYLTCFEGSLTSLTLQNLKKLETVICYDNQLTTLNVNGCTNLLELYAGNNKLNDLNLNDLINLQTLSIPYNKFSTINIQPLLNLKKFDCGMNLLTSLNLQGLVNLQNLYFNSNYITSINVQNLVNLQELICDNNKLTSLDVTGLSELKKLMFGENEIHSINLQGLTKLEELECNQTKLTFLDLKEFKNLRELHCTNTFLTSIDVQGLEKLTYFYLYDNPNLTSLFVKNGSEYFYGTLYNTPSLKYICCDEAEITYFQNYIQQQNLQNQCVANSYCSFTPGGNYNTIKGIAKIDSNNNGCDSNDLSFFPIKYSISDGTNSGIMVGSSDGTYKNFVNTGTYTITPIFENPDYFIASPQNHQFVFVDNNNNTQTKDFCITSNGTKNDLEVKIIPETSVRPGFSTSFKLIYKNKGNTVLSGNVNFNFDSTKSQYISADVSPNSQTTGNLLWNYDNLKPFESRTVNLILKTNPPPIVNVNDELVYSSSINPTIEDLTADDNTFVLHQIVVGSFDPNDKICLEGSTISPEMIGKYITYKIRFENTGTANAEQVVIKDDINTSMFDVNSIIPITASHSYQTRITDNIVEFIFENINLPFDDEHNDGYIVFKIKSLPNLVVGSELKNKADIFFDYNLPITTNEFVTHIQTLNTQEVNSAIKINIYPNPVKHYLNIQTNDKIMSIEIFDLNGRILQNIISSETKINVSNLKKGIYIIKINTSKGSTTQKIIKD